MVRLVQMLALFALPQAAWSGTGDTHLLAVDDRVNAPADTWFKFRAVTEEAGKTERVMVFEVQNKGPKRLVNFESPGDMRGTKVLVLSRQQMWVYLPAYKKVRRVASHVKQQGFMGTMYSDEDMSTSRYSEAYSADLVKEDADSMSLKLSPLPDSKAGYAVLEMDLRKDLMLPTEIRFFNSDGLHIKTETRPDYDCGDDVCTPTEMKMVDHTRGGASTRLIAEERKINQGVADQVFSVRNLERGR